MLCPNLFAVILSPDLVGPKDLNAENLLRVSCSALSPEFTMTAPKIAVGLWPCLS